MRIRRGIPGDSGAPVIDLKTSRLVGQIWSRSGYDEGSSLPHQTYFTAIEDILDDIYDRLRPSSRPVLPDISEDSASTDCSVSSLLEHTAGLAGGEILSWKARHPTTLLACVELAGPDPLGSFMHATTF
jgi:hypothetical protein